MRFNHLRPIIYTEEIDETIAFYTEVLGFSVIERNDDWGYAALYRDEVEIMLAKPNPQTPFQQPIFTGSFYINVNSVDKLWEQVKDKAKVCYPIQEFEWEMREFAIYDNNGYLLQFGQNIE